MIDFASSSRSGLPGPICVAAGPWSSGESDLSVLSGASAIVAKTVTAQPREGNPPPVLRRQSVQVVGAPFGYQNRIGLRNVGARAFVADRLPLFQSAHSPVIQSFAAQTESEVEEILSHLEPAPLWGYELNASCPNAPSALLSPTVLRQVLRRARTLSPRPIWVKLGYQAADAVLAQARVCVEEGATGIVAINTAPSLSLDLSESPTPFVGGLSGPFLTPLAQWTVALLVKEQSLPVIACGGIFGIEQILSYAALGAAAVQVGSALLERPQLVRTLVGQLQECYQSLGVTCFDELKESLCLRKPSSLTT